MLKRLNWIDFKIEIRNQNFSINLFKNKLNIFWKEVMETKLIENQHIWLLFRIQWSNNQFVTIGKLVKLNKEDKDYLEDFILKHMDDKSEYYKEETIKSMLFSYTIKKGRAKDKFTFESLDTQYQNFEHHKLPITMNPLDYGKLLEQIGNKFWIQVNKTNIAIITQLENLNEVKFFKEGELIYEYKDLIIDEKTFIRSLNNKKFTFQDSKLVLLTIDKTATYINPLKQLLNYSFKNKFITMDIETFIKDGIHIPFAISWYDGEFCYSYYLKYFNSSEDMLIQAIKELMIKKYDNYQVYIHNLAKFDAIFLLKPLAKLGQIKPIIHNKELISIGFKFNSYNITFKDSLQLLPGSLRKLALSFAVTTQKSVFPYAFVNERRLNYNSFVPDFKYFNDILITEYQVYLENFKNKSWNLEAEALKYCEIDCISLYQVIFKFSKMIFDLFKISVHKYPTLSSLAFAIFRTHFLKLNEISQLSGQIARDIRQSYTGGSVDVYIPTNEDGVNVYGFDVNSLYPFVMENNVMPIGNPTFFQGNIRKLDKDAFGFFYCKITSPEYLEHPILQTHVKINKTLRTIAPLGTWNDMIFSAEMDNAMKLGYTFEILWGYTFKAKNVFKDYVDTLYKLRSQYPKTDPMNLIAKLLLNSLYGRFGMDDSFVDITIFDDYKSFKKWYEINNESFISSIELGDKILVQHKSENKVQHTELYGNLETHNVNIGIAAAITAYARMHMSKFKNNSKYKLFYTDTDSVYLDKPLDDSMVSSTILGKMKLENTFNKAIFLAPKVYYLETIDDKVIYKVKGLKHEVELTKDDFENLMFKQSFLQKLQSKWIKNLTESNILIREDLYTLQVTDNKRKLIYDQNNKLIGTLPYIINENKEIINKD